VAAVLVVCLGACQATVGVDINVASNGGGVITVTAVLDRQAAAYASDIDLSGLGRAGWSVSGPHAAAAGAVTFTAARTFSNAAQAQAIVAEISGSTGPFNGLDFDTHTSLFRTTISIGGTVDLTCRLDCFADPALRQALGGPSLGIDPAALQNDAGIDLSDPVAFQLAVHLPGMVSANSSVVGKEARWQLPLGQKTAIEASSQSWNVSRLVIAGVLVVLVIVALVVALILWRRRRRQRRQHAQKRASRASRPAAA
jgi:hypothetical protein